MKYFVWEPSLLGPVASIWHGKLTDGNGKDRPALTIIALKDGDESAIEELKLRYPRPNEAS